MPKWNDLIEQQDLFKVTPRTAGAKRPGAPASPPVAGDIPTVSMEWNACCAWFAARPLLLCVYRQLKWSLFPVLVAAALTLFEHVGRVHVMQVAAAVTVFEHMARKAREEARAT